MTALRLGKASRYGLYALVRMALCPDERVTARDVAQAQRVSEHHVAKVLRTLRTAGLLEGARGAGGGYQLAREPAAVTMLEVVECLESPRSAPRGPGAAQVDRSGPAASREARAVHSVLREIDANTYFTLKSVTIATLAMDAVSAPTGGLRRAGPRAARKSSAVPRVLDSSTVAKSRAAPVRDVPLRKAGTQELT